MADLTTYEIQDFLQRMGRHYPHPGTFYLLGGSALCLLGSPRRTAVGRLSGSCLAHAYAYAYAYADLHRSMESIVDQ